MNSRVGHRDRTSLGMSSDKVFILENFGSKTGKSSPTISSYIVSTFYPKSFADSEYFGGLVPLSRCCLAQLPATTTAKSNSFLSFITTYTDITIVSTYIDEILHCFWYNVVLFIPENTACITTKIGTKPRDNESTYCQPQSDASRTVSLSHSYVHERFHALLSV